MKIAIDARIIYTSTGRYVERLIANLQEIDQTNEYVILLRQEDFNRFKPSAPNFTKVLADYPPYTFREQFGMWRQLRRLKADLVHFAVPQHPLLYRGKHVTTIHDLTLIDFVNRRGGNPLKRLYKYVIKPLVFRYVIWSTIRNSVEIITPTDYVRQQIIARYKVAPERITFTHEAAERLVARAQAVPELRDQTFILYVGNAFPYKNLQRLIDAAAGLKGAKLVLAGKPEYFYEQLEAHAKARDYRNIHFAGFVSDAELAWLYQNAKLYVFPSLSEGFGLPALEAMSYSLPVASSNATCLPEVYGEAAEYFNPTSTEDIRATISALLANPKRLAELRKAGSERVGQFSWRRMSEQTLEVYKKALKRP